MNFQEMLNGGNNLTQVYYCISIDIQTMGQTWNLETNPQAKQRITDRNYRQHISMTVILVMVPKIWCQRHRKQ